MTSTLLQQAVEALKRAAEWHSGDKWRNGDGNQRVAWEGHREGLAAAIASLESALQQQPEPVAWQFVVGPIMRKVTDYAKAYHAWHSDSDEAPNNELFRQQEAARKAVHEAVCESIIPLALQQQEEEVQHWRAAYLLAHPKELEAFVIAAEKNADDFLALNREFAALQQQEEPREADECAVDSIVLDLVAGLQRAEEKRKKRLADLPAGTCETCMGEGYLGSIESQRITDCPDCIGGLRSPSPQDFTLPMVEEGKGTDGVPEVPRG